MILLHTYQKNKTCQQHTTNAMRHDYATFGNQRSACVDNGSLCLRHLKKNWIGISSEKVDVINKENYTNLSMNNTMPLN